MDYQLGLNTDFCNQRYNPTTKQFPIKKMQKLYILFLFVALISCSSDVDQFIPNDISLLHSELRLLSNTKSSSFNLNNNSESVAHSVNNVEVVIPANIFFSHGELNNKPFQLDLIELNSYSDYITSRIPHITESDGIHNVLYSLYINAKNDISDDLNIIGDNTIKIRIPSKRKSGILQIAQGVVKGDLISWDFNNPNSNIRFTEWQVTNIEGINITESGYEFEVNKTGWYSLSVIESTPFIVQDLCIEIGDNKFNQDNTVVFLLSQESNYLLQAVNSNESSYCVLDTPLPDEAFRIITISYLANEDKFYYGAQSMDVSQEMIIIDINPSEISRNELDKSLKNL